jgi:predicted MPP superfamily phosphohydrolase
VSLFLVTFFTLYGSLQAYAYWRVQAALRLRGWPRLALVAFLLLMVFGLVLARRLDRAEWFRSARLVGLVAYYWLAVSMWVFCFGVLTDLWNGGMALAGIMWPGARRLALGPRPVLYGLAALILVLTVWGMVEVRRVRLRTFAIPTPRLTPEQGVSRIVQITDLHLGLLVRQAALGRALDAVRSARPDVLVCTGDLVDSTGAHLDDLVPLLAEVRPPLGKFAVTGNHEYYAGLSDSLAFHKRCGFRVLREESVLVDGRLRLCGVDDPAGRFLGGASLVNEDKALPRADRAEFTALLKHRPEVRAESAARFDLQISGHTHGGQVFPFTELERLEYGDRRSGFFQLAGGAFLYISRGAGVWGPPLRVFAPPEVALFILVPSGPVRSAASSR